jgi:hypothetical protein
MARSRKAAEKEPDTSFNPEEFDPAMKPEAATATADAPSQEAQREVGNGFAATVGKRQIRPLPDKRTVNAGQARVQFIDKGDNMAGIGIRVVFPEGHQITNEEKEIIRRHVKGEEGEKTGFAWQGDIGMWHKHIAREGERAEDIPASRAVAIRLDAESRVQKLADALRHHYADPIGYAAKIENEREQAAQSQAISA